MPAAAKMMADKGIAAGQVTGTGRDGRITKGDVIAAAEGGAPRAAAPAAAPAAARPALPEVKAPIDLSDARQPPRAARPDVAPARSAWPSGSCSRSRPPPS